MTDKRLIEVAFPLQQTSLDSVHEKNVRHGHISTLHIWPARRPLAASRAALIATLLPDPGDPVKRKEILERLAGKLVAKEVKKALPSGKTEIVKTFETVGGILHWGRESGPDLDWFRGEIKKAYGGRAPKVLDPFAGGGAIPLEAMRLGCEVTAVDINPVAWFILKCTLEYPQKLAGQKRRLPDFAIADREFMEAFFKSQGLKGAALRTQSTLLFGDDGAPKQFGAFDEIEPLLEADLSWHVRAWGRWVLKEARKELGRYYPTYASFEALDGSTPKAEEGALELAPLNVDGEADVSALNRDFAKDYLENPTKPRWIAKPTVAYLWARTVACKNCRATIPLLKTRWLFRKGARRVLLRVGVNHATGRLEFGVSRNEPMVGGNAAARREHDRRIGSGTLNRSGAKCLTCAAIMTPGDIQLEGRAGRLGSILAAVICEGSKSKEFRVPTRLEEEVASSEALIATWQTSIFRGIDDQLIPAKRPSPNTRGTSGLPTYGFTRWSDIFTHRQKASLATIGSAIERAVTAQGKLNDWQSAIGAYLVATFDKVLTNNSGLCSWNCNTASVRHTFARFALPMVWDFVELNPIGPASGAFANCLDWVMSALNTCDAASAASPAPTEILGSAIHAPLPSCDVIVTDPPYYDAIPYSDLMDFYHVWLRHLVPVAVPALSKGFHETHGPKWDRDTQDGELIDQPSRFNGDASSSKAAYESGMAQVFARCGEVLAPSGRMVVVFANKQPDAWATLVGALVKAGFVVDGSWPIQTERASRSNALAAAALSSSVWLVCRRRPETARPGWDNRVLDAMHQRITTQLREFWDAGIRGPDFVWAATGPALEAYSQHPVVKKANSPSELMSVTEFLQHVRRIVVDFVVGRVLSGDGEGGDEASGLDDVTTYYLLHRHDFGFDEAPVGACILYAVSCGLTDRELSDQYDLVSRAGGAGSEAESEDSDDTAEDGDDEPVERSSGNVLKLKAWNQRKAKDLGLDAPRGKGVPLIDQVHRIMRLWKAGDVVKVNEYLDQRALRSNHVFHQLVQALIELAPHASEERSLLESISNHVAARGVAVQDDLNVYSAE